MPLADITAVPRRRGRVRETRAAPGFPASRQSDRESGGEHSTRALPVLLDVAELAHLLGIGRTKAYELIAREEIPSIRVGRCVRVPVDELRAWISSRVIVPLDSQDRS
jgi:prophage regulatory protein